MPDGAVIQLSLRARIGRQWFRWRGFSPVPFLVLMLILPADFSWNGLSYLWVISGIVLVECVRVWAVGYAGSSTRTRSEQVLELVHAGPFRFVRNPLYLSNIALYTLTGLLFGFVYLSAILFIYTSIQYSLIVAFEEEILSSTFGGPYLAYKEAVPRWFFSLRPAVKSTLQQFDLWKALRSERSTFFVILILSILFFAKTKWLGY